MICVCTTYRVHPFRGCGSLTFIMTYLPSSCFINNSTIMWMMPHMLFALRVIWIVQTGQDDLVGSPIYPETYHTMDQTERTTANCST